MAAFSGLVAISLGLGLAAASGFRVFLPPMLLSGAINVGLIEASGQLALLDGWGAFSVLLIAVVLEIGSYLIPWLDNLLDVVATPTAVLAGVGLMGSVIGAETDYDPIVQWAIAAIGGGGVAGTVQTGTVATRALSTGTTGGLANPIISVVEAVMAIVVTVLALLAPLLCLALVCVGSIYALRVIETVRSKPNAAPLA
ncbi:DUF4126 domain-containing protein [bacterium]|nr:DUF4126 domain-containing protein [Candidatus Poseidoniales archaeon]MDB2618480.1 DUF4126 domain-containing protein [bacterium]MDB2624415.1 DUF4126 domain-containing protein [Candidatus Poseidoniales archaeon]